MFSILVESASIKSQIESLRSNGEFFRMFEVQYHTENGTLSACCHTAHLCLTSAVLASSSKGGIAGVLDYLRAEFAWGLAYDTHFCTCLSHSKELGCVVKMAMSTIALKHYCKLALNPKENFSIGRVQLILRCGIEESRLYRQDIKNKIHTGWVSDNCNYHECIGLIDQISGEVVIWDDGTRLEFQRQADSHGAILSLRILAEPSALPSAPFWSTYGPVRLNCWIDLLDEPVIVREPLRLSLTIPINPLIYISGVGGATNPFSGNGVGRAVREGFPCARLVCADHGGPTYNVDSAMCDPVFNAAHISVITGGVNGTCEEQYAAIALLLKEDEQALLIPCRDSDVENLSKEKVAQDEFSVYRRILCPGADAVALTEKPTIHAATKGPLADFFRVPSYLTLGENTGSLFEVQVFAESKGYPVCVKGTRKGCTKCEDWTTLRAALGYYVNSHSDGFVQEVIPGEEHCLAFAAFEGELTGCVLMVKDTCLQGKVWDGTICPVPAQLQDALREFVSGSQWTGGGEIEYVSDFLGNRWIIDFNPRFPAWIAASSFSGCNLPAELVQHALYELCRTPVRDHIPFSQLPGKAALSRNAHAVFTKSLVEMPRCNLTVVRRQFQGAFFDLKIGKDGSTEDSFTQYGRPLLKLEEPTFNLRDTPKPSVLPSGALEVNSAVHLVNEDLMRLKSAAGKLLLKHESEGLICTPRRILVLDIVSNSMIRQRQLLTDAATATTQERLQIAMCVSVKTQPHKEVLRLALNRGFLAECISLAEVHAALAVGYVESQIVLTGPGKFWDIQHRQLNKALKCIFADSLMELRHIVARVLDPQDWLDCAEIGVRFMPTLMTDYSRFGLDCSDVGVIAECVAVIKTLPAEKHLSVQFHFASSTVGADSWFGQAQAYAVFSAEFAKMCNRSLHTIDFGGGWTPYFLSPPENGHRMQQLFACVCSSFQSPLPCVQFELGKSLSEMAGGILTSVLSIREIKSSITVKGYVATTGDTPSNHVNDNREMGDRAAIIDTSVGEISCLHIHPIFRMKPIPRQQNGDSKCDGCEWEQLELGGDEIWGRTCMEFDRLYFDMALPRDLKIGDVLLISATGSYDFTNSYDFGDGLERDIAIL